MTADLPKWLGYFEAILKKNGSGFFVGKKVITRIPFSSLFLLLCNICFLLVTSFNVLMLIVGLRC